MAFSKYKHEKLPSPFYAFLQAPTISLHQLCFKTNMDHDMTQVVSCQALTVKGQVQLKDCPWGICDRQSDTWQVFPPNSIISPILHNRSSITDAIYLGNWQHHSKHT